MWVLTTCHRPLRRGILLHRLADTVDPGREHGLPAIGANDHFVFSEPPDVRVSGREVRATVDAARAPSPRRPRRSINSGAPSSEPHLIVCYGTAVLAEGARRSTA